MSLKARRRRPTQCSRLPSPERSLRGRDDIHARFPRAGSYDRQAAVATSDSRRRGVGRTEQAVFVGGNRDPLTSRRRPESGSVVLAA
jgi:hypothetical protein